jgi:FkbM family methyltransferase
VEESSLLVEKGMAGATGNIYCGLLEFEDMAFLLHLLRPGDLVGDIGANVGAYTVLAAKNGGADVISIEPVPATFEHLKNNIGLNQINQRVKILNCGVAGENGSLKFTSEQDAVNHVVAASEENAATLSVPVQTLDSVFNDRHPFLMKIDVEGFEHEVIKGGSKTLQSASLNAIIIELNGSGMRYGFNDICIHNQLVEYNFLPYSYEPFSRKLGRLDAPGKFNTIYVRDVDLVMQRIATAKKFTILGQEI